MIKVINDTKHFLRNAQQGGEKKTPTQLVTEVFLSWSTHTTVIAEIFEAANEGARALKVIYKDETEYAVIDFDSAL